MEIKEKIEELVNKFKTDKNFAENFKKNPVNAVEGVLGIDLPDEQINKIIEGVKAKVSLDKLGAGSITEMLGGVLGGKKK